MLKIKCDGCTNPIGAVYYSRNMPGERSMRDILHNMLKDSDLSFRDFVDVALYHPELGYYSRLESPVGRAADYVTSPAISPVFGYSLGRLVSEFLSRSEERRVGKERGSGWARYR